MIALTVKSKALTTMIRKGYKDFNSFPATIALEKVEAKALFGTAPRKNVFVHNSFTSLSPCIRPSKTIEDTFPKIEWEDDDVNSSFEERQQGVCSLVGDSEVLIRSPKRRKLTCGFLSEIHHRNDKKGLIRTQRIITKLHLLENDEDDYTYVPSTTRTISSHRQQVIRDTQFSSSRNGCDDPNIEKLLQMSFCDDGGDYQVTIVA